MKKVTKYQQYFHCFIVYILVSYPFWFSYQQNIVTILVSVIFRGAAPIRGRHLFQCRQPKLRCLLEGEAYLKPALIRGNMVCVPNKTKNLNVFNMITGMNESKTLAKHISCKCEFRFNGRKCNSDQWWNNDNCRCESKKRHACEKDYV